MKIKVVEKSFDEVMTISRPTHRYPSKQKLLFRWLLKTLSAPDLKKSHFTFTEEGMDKLDKKQPCLYLMNHSAFIDLEIAATIIYPRQFHIVCTEDGFVGKEGLMRHIGCIPTKKFIPEVRLIKDMEYCLDRLHSSVLMYPEASYTFDGTATPLPESLGKCLKLLKVPVVMIRTFGAFARDPLYNNLQIRQCDVSAQMTYLLSPEEIAQKSVEELNALLKETFTFDNFRWQQENHIVIDEPFRADYLNRVLFKCPHCLTEGEMKGEGTRLTCQHCGETYELDEFGYLNNERGKFNHVPDWYRWEREQVIEQLQNDSYRLQVPVEIYMMVDTSCIYHVGNGEMTHSKDGFHLTGCDGKIDYYQSPTASYGLYADYYWYELGDMICIGTSDCVYYCFPQSGGDIVAKTRLATEELYKMNKSRKA